MIISTAQPQSNISIETNRWQGRGAVAQAPVPAISLFEQADALFQVEKRELTFPIIDDREAQDSPHRIIPGQTGIFGLVRTDTQHLLGAVSKQYEIVQNDSLLRMAEFIREEAEMDSVYVISNGEKVAFTANIRGASLDVVPGDTIKRRFVGYLGHDGKTGCGAMFTNIRVICANTLATAKRDASSKVSIRHKTGANENFDSLIQSIDVSRQRFAEEVELFRAMTDVQLTGDDFREFLSRCYARQLAVPVRENGQERPRRLEDMRVFPHLQNAFHSGLGATFVPGSMWNAVNSVTQIETSTMSCTNAQRPKMFAKANFGTGQDISRKAIDVAADMLAMV